MPKPKSLEEIMEEESDVIFAIMQGMLLGMLGKTVDTEDLHLHPEIKDEVRKATREAMQAYGAWLIENLPSNTTVEEWEEKLGKVGDWPYGHNKGYNLALADVKAKMEELNK